MAEKLLLHIQYECSRHKIDLPWDAIAHRLHPGSSGGAITQHLNRIRGTLVAEGHLVPPICQKPGSKVNIDPTIRGFVRKDLDSADATTTRPVSYNEPMDDRRFNLPDAMVDLTKTPKQRGQGGSPRKAAKIKHESPSPDPLDMQSDAEYDPGAKPKADRRRRSTRAKGPKNYAVEDEPMEEATEDAIEPSMEEAVEQPMKEQSGEAHEYYEPSQLEGTGADFAEKTVSSGTISPDGPVEDNTQVKTESPSKAAYEDMNDFVQDGGVRRLSLLAASSRKVRR